METLNKIVELMKKKGVTQRALTAHLGITESQFSSWKSGQSSSYKKYLYKIAAFLEVSPEELLGQTKKDILTVVSNGKNIFMIPVYESVSAGFGAFADSEVQSYMPMMVANPDEAKEMLMIRVEGDSMHPKIENGSYVFVHKQTSVDSGSIAVASIDEEDYVVKKVEYGPEWIRLVSINPSYPDRIFRGREVLRVRIVGLVRGEYKMFD